MKVNIQRAVATADPVFPQIMENICEDHPYIVMFANMSDGTVLWAHPESSQKVGDFGEWSLLTDTNDWKPFKGVITLEV